MQQLFGLIVLFLCGALAGCGSDSDQGTPPQKPPTTAVAKENPVVDSKQPDKFAPVTTQTLPLQTPQAESTATSTSQDIPPEQIRPDTGKPPQLPSVRLPDDRPDLNEARLLAVGIKRFESERLVLVTDLPDEQVAALPALADQLFQHLERHFGTLPRALDDSEFQVTGYLIENEDAFRSSGLMPQEGFTFQHGRHQNYQFWMFSPEANYYRRHLLFHEFTHCFMTCESGMQNIPSLWYIEGMAEYFGTHRLDKDGGIQFGILPEQFEGYEGWGRISEIRRSFQPRALSEPGQAELLTIPTLKEVMPEADAPFDQDAQYATSWALCWFLHNHPRYQQSFAPLRKLRTRKEFMSTAAEIRNADLNRLSIDWLLFYESLLENFDTERSFAAHTDQTFSVTDLSSPGLRTFTLAADLGWQDSGLRLQAGQNVKVSCSGRYAVNNQPQPWISEPQGITIEYVRGLPLGQVVGTLVSEDGSSVSNRISIGREAVITAGGDVSLWLQVNDTSNSRSNNNGSVEVVFSRHDKEPVAN